MPHGGYHGTVKMGGNVVQQGYQDNSGNYQVRGGIDDASRLDFNPPQSNQNNQNINQQIENKKKEIEAINDLQEGTFESMFTDDGRMFGTMTTGTQGVDAKGLATLQNFQNQQLNNLLQQQQEINLANQLKSTFAKAGTDKADALRPLFTGDLGDKTFLGMNLGSTERPAATVINPFTGERITTGKVREGMTSPEYAQYMSELYGLNPALMEETFPFGSGQIAKPLFVKALDAVKGVGSGIAGLPGISELGQMVGNVGSAIVSPLSGLFTGQSTATPQTPGSTYEELLQQYGRPNLIPDNLLVPQGDTQAVDKFGNPVLSMGQYSSVPEEFMQGFMNSPFYKNVPGGAAITYVTLPDGRKIKFGDTGSASQFRQYLESIGAMQPESTEDFKQVKSQPTGLPAIADYASMAPQFTGSPYTNQGVSPAFLENLRRFYG